MARSSLLSKLGINIDHVATLRQLRGTPYPDLLEAARLVEKAGGHQITVHLREDRRHIQPDDVKKLRKNLKIPLNLEMAVNEEMTRFALKIKPEWVCLVPEKRQELTTEGGLDVSKSKAKIKACIARVKKAGIKVSCFIEPSLAAVKLSSELGSDAVEFHTGRFCIATQAPFSAQSPARAKKELSRIVEAAKAARRLSLHPHAGHGLDYENVREISSLTPFGWNGSDRRV